MLAQAAATRSGSTSRARKLGMMRREMKVDSCKASATCRPVMKTYAEGCDVLISLAVCTCFLWHGATLPDPQVGDTSGLADHGIKELDKDILARKPKRIRSVTKRTCRSLLSLLSSSALVLDTFFASKVMQRKAGYNCARAAGAVAAARISLANANVVFHT